jgi:site-specific DNA-methyltransferase (adenine-specific)
VKPYYEDDAVTIYHGDCREILPTLPPVDLVLTDPPYGVTIIKGGGRGMNGWKDYSANGEWDKTPPSDALIEQVVAAGSSAIVWGGNYFKLPISMGWLVWDKGQRNFSLADGELAWTTESRALRIFSFARAAALRETKKEHPTQKPIALMRWCLEFFPDAQTILDPFMGSGTTLRAAKDLGRKAIGIEIEERYCEIAAKRMAQTVMPL